MEFNKYIILIAVLSHISVCLGSGHYLWGGGGGGGLVDGENKDWKLFWLLYQTKGKLFLPLPLIKVETFLTPPSVDWKINTAMKQVCIAGRVRY
jgi:hypothetical protein